LGFLPPWYQPWGGGAPKAMGGKFTRKIDTTLGQFGVSMGLH